MTRLFLSVGYVLFAFLPSIFGQRLQIQAGIGTNYSKAFIKDEILLQQQTNVRYDSIGNIQYGVGLDIQLHKNIFLRVDGNYKAFSTNYMVDYETNSHIQHVTGHLFKEVLTVSVLPEYRFIPTGKGKFALPFFVYGGLAVSVEQGKGESYSIVTSAGPTQYPRSQREPQPVFGFGLGIGVNPKWGRLGFLLEARYSRLAAAQEVNILPKMGFGHFTLMGGLSYDLKE